VTLTDLPSVLPLLDRNVRAAAVSPGALPPHSSLQAGSTVTEHICLIRPCAAVAASVEVRALHGVGTMVAKPLTWDVHWPYAPLPDMAVPDIVLGTDVVYYPELVEPLVQTLIALCGPRTIVLLANERRSPMYEGLNNSLMELRAWRLNRLLPPAALYVRAAQSACHVRGARVAVL